LVGRQLHAIGCNPVDDMLPRPPLPPEIAIYIIDHLSDCPTSLTTCSRVCRDWLAISRPHFFHRITFVLNGRGVYKRARTLYSLIEQCPSIALYIRELSIVREPKMRLVPKSDWVKLGSVVPLLFGKLTGLHKFEVTGINWIRLMPTVRSSIRDLFALPSLVHLAVRCVKVSRIEHLTAMLPPNLKRLTVDNVYVHADNGIMMYAIDKENLQVSAQSPRQLEYLKVYNAPDFYNWLLGEQSDVDMSSIHTLDVCKEPENISKLVRKVGPSLQHLKISYLFGESRLFWITRRFSYTAQDSNP
jgi:hypothetical protein